MIAITCHLPRGTVNNISFNSEKRKYGQLKKTIKVEFILRKKEIFYCLKCKQKGTVYCTVYRVKSRKSKRKSLHPSFHSEV